MIYDSHIWRKEVQSDLNKLKQFLDHADLSSAEVFDQAAFEIEKFVFLSAYLARKLVDSNKLSDEMEGTNWPVSMYQRSSEKEDTTFLGWHNFENYYDVEGAFLGKKGGIGLRQLCNTLIHSHVFAPVLYVQEKRYWILFNSDTTKDKVLYQMDLAVYIQLIEQILKDDIVFTRWSRVTGKTIKSKYPENHPNNKKRLAKLDKALKRKLQGSE